MRGGGAALLAVGSCCGSLSTGCGSAVDECYGTVGHFTVYLHCTVHTIHCTVTDDDFMAK